jgi:hypothetical protein
MNLMDVFMNAVYVKFSRLLFALYTACSKRQHREKQIIVSRGPCFVWLSWNRDVSWHHNTDFKYLRFISRNDIHVKQRSLATKLCRILAQMILRCTPA